MRHIENTTPNDLTQPDTSPQNYVDFWNGLTSCGCKDSSYDKCDAQFHRSPDPNKGITKEECYWDVWETQICKWFLQNDPYWRNKFIPGSVVGFKDWGYGVQLPDDTIDSDDLGIDLVARDYQGSLWGIQAKGYKEDQVSLAHIDSFIALLGTEHTSNRLDRSKERFDKGLILTTMPGLFFWTKWH